MLGKINAPLILTGKRSVCGRKGLLDRAGRAVMTAPRALWALQSRALLGCGQLGTEVSAQNTVPNKKPR